MSYFNSFASDYCLFHLTFPPLFLFFLCVSFLSPVCVPYHRIFSYSLTFSKSFFIPDCFSSFSIFLRIFVSLASPFYMCFPLWFMTSCFTWYCSLSYCVLFLKETSLNLVITCLFARTIMPQKFLIFVCLGEDYTYLSCPAKMMLRNRFGQCIVHGSFYFLLNRLRLRSFNCRRVLMESCF